MVKEQATITASDETARSGRQAQDMTPFAGALPFCAFERLVARKDDAEGEVARGGSHLKRIMQCEELDPSGALVGGWQCRAIDARAFAQRRPLEAGSSGKPQCTSGVAGNGQGRDGQVRLTTDTQAQPCGSDGYHAMAVSAARIFCQWFRSFRQRDRTCRVCGLDCHDIRRNLGRP